MFSSTRRFNSACSLGRYPIAKRPSIQAKSPASTRLCRQQTQLILRHLMRDGRCTNRSCSRIHDGMHSEEPDFILAVMEHLEEAVQQGWLAVLNHDVPNFNLHAAALVRYSCLLQTLCWCITTWAPVAALSQQHEDQYSCGETTSPLCEDACAKSTLQVVAKRDAKSETHLKEPGQNMQAECPCPGMWHMLVEGGGCEPHGNAQKHTPGEASNLLQRCVIQSVQDEHQQSPVDHCCTADTPRILRQYIFGPCPIPSSGHHSRPCACLHCSDIRQLCHAQVSLLLADQMLDHMIPKIVHERRQGSWLGRTQQARHGSCSCALRATRAGHPSGLAGQRRWAVEHRRARR